jgi:hypothetical protein
MMPVLYIGYVVGLQIFSLNPLPLNQTSFLTLTQRPFSWFECDVIVMKDYIENEIQIPPLPFLV